MPDRREGIHVCRKNGLLGRRWYWHGVAANGEITMQSEIYNSRDAAYNGIRATARLFGGSILDRNSVMIYENGARRDLFGRPFQG
jgi:hypothetical protein